MKISLAQIFELLYKFLTEHSSFLWVTIQINFVFSQIICYFLFNLFFSSDTFFSYWKRIEFTMKSILPGTGIH